MLPIDWIFKSQSGQKSTFKDFLNDLKDISNEQVYSLEFTGALVDYVWDYYSQQIRYRVFYPFIL